MREAISMMQIVLQNKQDNGGSHSDNLNSNSPCWIYAKIDRASKYLASSQAVSSTAAIEVRVASHDGIGVHFPDAESPLLLGSSYYCLPQASFAVPIRLDHLSYDYQDERDPELEAALMLFNFGVTHFCQSRELSSKHSSSTKTSRAMAKASVRLFKASLETMHNYVAPATADLFPEDELMIECIVLSHLVQTQLDLGKLADAQSCYQQMRIIQDLQGETLMDMCSMDIDTAAATA